MFLFKICFFTHLASNSSVTADGAVYFSHTKTLTAHALCIEPPPTGENGSNYRRGAKKGSKLCYSCYLWYVFSWCLLRGPAFVDVWSQATIYLINSHLVVLLSPKSWHMKLTSPWCMHRANAGENVSVSLKSTQLILVYVQSPPLVEAVIAKRDPPALVFLNLSKLCMNAA